MDREKLFRHLEQRYTSKRDMISRIPLGTQPDALWQELLNQRRSRSTVLPLYNYKGLPYWFVTTDKMVAASERVVEALYEIETEFDPYTEALPVSTLEEVFYTSYVEGSQISIQAAMDFLTSDLPPRDIEEQMIANNRQASNYASGNLYRPIDAEYLKELVYLLTDGMDQGGQDYRSTNEVDFTPTSGEAFAFPSVRTIPDRLGELSAFLELPNTHPLVKAAVAQAYLMILRPFPEGNERLGRMVSNIILLRAGYTFFSEISLSALIARKSYSYYEAMLNILREENGCDLTYFIEYYLELLSRAVEERRLRQRQKEERARQEEMALARTPLMAAAVPASDPTPPDSGRPAPPGPETAEASEVPTETDPNNPERGGENKDWLSADSWAGNDTEMDSETSIARVRGKLCHLASNSGPVMKTGAKFLLSLMDNQVDTFTVDDIVNGCGFTLKQAGNFVTHLREMSLIESVGKRTNRCMIYQFATAQLPLGPQDYSPEIMQAIAELRSSARSAKDRRIGEILAASLAKGMITAADYTDAEDAAKIYTDMLLPEQMGIVKKVAPGVYRINRNIIETLPTPSGSQKTALSALYQSFGSEPFTREGAMAAMKLGKSSTCSLLHQLSLLRLIDCQENDVFVYRLRVNPNDHPTLFAGEPTPPVSPPEDNHSAPEPVAALAEGYSQDVLEQLNILSESSTSNRDRRVSEVLRSCLAKGTLLRSDYEARGYSDNMWLADTALAAQLGLITKQPDGDYTINRELQTEFSKLKPHQRKAITAIYEAFGYDTFSSEMFVATLNYSVSYTYASLHKLTLLRILEQKITDEGCQYQLLVNPEDHPECFIEAA